MTYHPSFSKILIVKLQDDQNYAEFPSHYFYVQFKADTIGTIVLTLSRFMSTVDSLKGFVQLVIKFEVSL